MGNAEKELFRHRQLSRTKATIEAKRAEDRNGDTVRVGDIVVRESGSEWRVKRIELVCVTTTYQNRDSGAVQTITKQRAVIVVEPILIVDGTVTSIGSGPLGLMERPFKPCTIVIKRDVTVEPYWPRVHFIERQLKEMGVASDDSIFDSIRKHHVDSLMFENGSPQVEVWNG